MPGGRPGRALLVHDPQPAAKVRAFRENARAVLALRADGSGLSPFLWAFVDGRPIVSRWGGLAQIPASTPLSVTVSKALTRRGFRFVGPTIVYAFLQSAGLVNDHTLDCFRHPDNAGASAPG